MSFSIDGISSLVDSTASLASSNSDKVKNSANSLSSDSTDEELMDVCKDFASYFVEQVLKEVKESLLPEDEDEDSSLSTLTDFHMDSVIEELADEVVDEAGTSFTQQLYEQMKRNYNI